MFGLQGGDTLIRARLQFGMLFGGVGGDWLFVRRGFIAPQPTRRQLTTCRHPCRAWHRCIEIAEYGPVSKCSCVTAPRSCSSKLVQPWMMSPALAHGMPC